jgi:hypothetical protein
MSGKKDKGAPVKGSATAKLEAVAKATYTRKRTITEVIPPDVTRAKTSAWLDLISPLTEWAGLKGDQLREKRLQLRLQREDVLAEIVRRARVQIKSPNKAKKPIPNKFLVPFLEKASLEQPDSSLIDMWASLLASAAAGISSYHVHFVTIISQLSPKQGDILASLIDTGSLASLELARDNIFSYLENRSIRKTVEERVSALSEKTDDAFEEAIKVTLDQIGITPVHAAAENLKTKIYFDIEFADRSYRDTDEVDYSILEAVGLIRRVDTGFFDVEEWAAMLTYYHLTDLGFYFAKACGIVRSDD